MSSTTSSTTAEEWVGETLSEVCVYVWVCACVYVSPVCYLYPTPLLLPLFLSTNLSLTLHCMPGLYNSASLAAMTGRRLIVSHEPFNRMFLPPYSDMNRDDVEFPDSWDYGLSANENFNKWDSRETWDYEAHGRDVGNYKMWANTIRMNPLSVGLTKPIMTAGVCGGDRSILIEGE